MNLNCLLNKSGPDLGSCFVCVRTSVAGFAVLSIKGNSRERRSGSLKGECHSTGFFSLFYFNSK